MRHTKILWKKVFAANQDSSNHRTLYVEEKIVASGSEWYFFFFLFFQQDLKTSFELQSFHPRLNKHLPITFSLALTRLVSRTPMYHWNDSETQDCLKKGMTVLNFAGLFEVFERHKRKVKGNVKSFKIIIFQQHVVKVGLDLVLF